MKHSHITSEIWTPEVENAFFNDANTTMNRDKSALCDALDEINYFCCTGKYASEMSNDKMYRAYRLFDIVRSVGFATTHPSHFTLLYRITSWCAQITITCQLYNDAKSIITSPTALRDIDRYVMLMRELICCAIDDPTGERVAQYVASERIDDVLMSHLLDYDVVYKHKYED